MSSWHTPTSIARYPAPPGRGQVPGEGRQPARHPGAGAADRRRDGSPMCTTPTSGGRTDEPSTDQAAVRADEPARRGVGWAIVAGATLLATAPRRCCGLGGALATRAATGALAVGATWSPVLVVTAAGDVARCGRRRTRSGCGCSPPSSASSWWRLVGVPALRWGINRVDSDSAHRALATHATRCEALTLPARRAQVATVAADPAGRSKTRQIPAAEAGIVMGHLHHRPQSARPAAVGRVGRRRHARSWRPGRGRPPRWRSRRSCPRPGPVVATATRPTC